MKIKILNLLLAAIFILSGAAKLLALEFELAAFERWGYPLWFMYFTGLVEVFGGVALLVKRISALAAAGLSLVMFGATSTHLMHGEWPMLALASIIMALSLWHAWLGRFEMKKFLNTKQDM